MLDEVRARRGAVAGDDVDRAGGEPDLGRELGDAQHAQRRLRIGLQHDGAARGQGGRQLPRRHEQRVVPGNDLRADADRLLQRVRQQRAADRIRAAGDRAHDRREEAEVLDRAGDLGLDRRDRLADIAGLELGELAAVRLDRVGEGVEQTCALVRRRAAPGAVERGAGGADGTVDVGLAGHRRPGERLAGGRLGQVADLARCGLGRLAVDEEPVIVARGDSHRTGK
jgi:hypothetical protein